MQLFIDLIDPTYYDNLHLWLIFAHVLTAVISLMTGVWAMVVHKGGKTHRQVGKVYFWGMFVANFTAIVLLYWRFNLFLLGVTVLSFYAALTGYRVLYRKRPQNGRRATLFDWISAVAALLTGTALIVNSGLGLFGFGAFGIPPEAYGPSVVVILPIIFGSMVASSGYTDIKQFSQPISDKNWWWYYHMNRMLSSYIGLTTALMVQQVAPQLPGAVAWIVWILPAVVGTVGIVRWIRSYRRQFGVQPV
ncbi:MAG: hypothetical protein QNJ45_15105 [Ardenticatenaceae bacterium]|nr:hypothetical protein [Ardenticatenaceae bacterium]